jgi:alkyl sulfatase BDS1-like metallo-beta-lactamase superfamily hydrolase
MATNEKLDFQIARGMKPVDAAFFYMGAPGRVTDRVAFSPGLANVCTFIGDGALFLVDTATGRFTPTVLEGIRAQYSQAPIEGVVYTHGHVDHTTGAGVIQREADSRGDRRPRIIGHDLVAPRFDRYQLTAAHNDHINQIQFNLPSGVRPFTDAEWTYPDVTYSRDMDTRVGGLTFELHHSRGETDDETWVWCPEERTLCTGDTFVWCSPNAGNPYKVQRYAKDWADALEQMAALKPAHLLPGHGPVINDEGTIEEALLSTAHLLRSIHDQVVGGMNKGKLLEDIMRDMEWPATDKPWLRPIYDHPEFIARNVFRLYGGWWDGNAATMLPAHSSEVMGALVDAVGAEPILNRAKIARDQGKLRLACHLVDFVRLGNPENREAWELWRDLFTARVAEEESLMARGAFKAAVREAEARLQELD